MSLRQFYLDLGVPLAMTPQALVKRVLRKMRPHRRRGARYRTERHAILRGLLGLHAHFQAMGGFSHKP